MVTQLDLFFLGDLMLGRGVSRKLPKYGPEWFWGEALPLLRGADAVFGNLETSITERRVPFYKKAYHFRADPAAVSILTAAGVGLVNQANNHSLDYGPGGLADTMAALDGAGIVHVGAGVDLAAACAPAYVTVKGVKIGFIAGSDAEPEFGAGPSKPGTRVLDFKSAETALALAPQLAAMKAEGADLKVLTLHWGPNMRQTKPDAFRSFAHAAIEAGIDVVHGHSAHLTQGVERHAHGLILYDTGNVIDDYIKFPFMPDDRSFLFRVTRDNAGRLSLRLTPIALPPSPLRLMRGPDGDKRRRKMIEESKVLGATLLEDDGDLVLA